MEPELAPPIIVEAEDSKDSKFRSRRWFCGLLTGFALIVSGILNVLLYMKFTPVYTEMECGDMTASLDKFVMGLDTIRLEIVITVVCSNPNPYKIDILTSTPGRVFVGLERRLQVGEMEVIPGSQLNEHGHGKFRVRMTAEVSGGEADELLPHFLDDKAVPILLELQFQIGIYISFGLGSWEAAAPFKKACGLNMAGVLVNRYIPASADAGSRSRLGPLVCRSSFNDMQIPNVGEDAPKDGRMGFSAANLAPKEVQAGECAKNVSLGTCIFGSFFGSLLILYGTLIGFPPRPSLAPLRDYLKSLLPSRETLASLVPSWQEAKPYFPSCDGLQSALHGRAKDPSDEAGAATIPLIGGLCMRASHDVGTSNAQPKDTAAAAAAGAGASTPHCPSSAALLEGPSHSGSRGQLPPQSLLPGRSRPNSLDADPTGPGRTCRQSGADSSKQDGSGGAGGAGGGVGHLDEARRLSSSSITSCRSQASQGQLSPFQRPEGGTEPCGRPRADSISSASGLAPAHPPPRTRSEAEDKAIVDRVRARSSRRSSGSRSYSRSPGGPGARGSGGSDGEGSLASSKRVSTPPVRLKSSPAYSPDA